ncbi:malate dehydrogenase [Mycena venus]|uniref:malate dehydrogenase n=1 Tax=Mycena venus TaxID=2733690 RepID=A0A8H6WYS7_9AGAR|nr:malate dehydrogenase [Mycena venus]
MFSRSAIRTLAAPSSRLFSSSSARHTKVAVLGAGGGIGQPLSLLLKSDPLVTSLSLYDIRGAPGVAADVSHVDTASEVKGYAADHLDDALEGVQVVVIPAGVPRKPGMTRDDLFNTNASIVRDLAAAVARVAPTACVLVISNPVNSTVPIVAATLEKAGVFDPKRVFGVTTLDVVRAARFTAGVTNAKPSETPVTVSSKGKTVSGEVYEKLVHRIQFGGDEVVQAKEGAGSATLSMAYAGAKFANAVLRGLNGEKGVTTPTFVKSPLFADQGIDFFSSNVELGPNGVEKIHPLGELSAEEQKLLDACLPELKKNIEKGKAFAA